MLMLMSMVMLGVFRDGKLCLLQSSSLTASQPLRRSKVEGFQLFMLSLIQAHAMMNKL